MTQVWPEEQFTDGAAASATYRRGPDLYMQVRPWGTSPETTTGLLLGCANGAMFDGYQRAAGAASGLAAAARRDEGDAGDGVDGDAVWSVARGLITGSGQVLGVPALLVSNGVNNNDSFRSFGICCNVSGGTYATPGSDSAADHYLDVSGYFLIEARQTLSRHRLFLLELASGAITVLASQDVRDIDPEHAGPIDSRGFQPRTLRLKVAAVGAGANITAFRTVPGVGEVQLFDSATIVRGARLPVGRSGFGVQSLRTDSTGADVVGIIESFRAFSEDSGTVTFRDDFRRLIPEAARIIGNGAVTGRSLASAWIGDSESAADVSIGSREQLRRGTTVSAVDTGEPSGLFSAAPGFALSQNPTQGPSQSYVASFTRIDSELSLEVEMGIAVRFSLTPFITGALDARGRAAQTPFDRIESNRRGYTVSVVRSGAGVWTLEFRHFDGTTSSQAQSQLIGTASLAGASLAEDQAFVLKVDVQNTDGDRFGVGTFVALQASVDGAIITPIAGAQTGVVVQGDFLIDTRTVATQQAGGAGFVVAVNGAPTSDLVRIASFVESTPLGNTELAPEDMATVTVASEAATVSGTLDVPIEIGMTEGAESEPLSWRMENGKRVVLVESPQDRRIVSVSVTLEREEWLRLLRLHESNGSAVPFAWTRPDTNEATTGMFVDESLALNMRHAEDGRVIYSSSFRIEEIFSASTYNG